MEYGENRPTDKVHGGFSQRTCGNVLTKKDILYALRAISLIKKAENAVLFQQFPLFYFLLSTHKFFHSALQKVFPA